MLHAMLINMRCSIKILRVNFAVVLNNFEM